MSNEPEGSHGAMLVIILLAVLLIFVVGAMTSGNGLFGIPAAKIHLSPKYW